MKKKYLMGLLLISTLAFTACGNKNTLKCTATDKNNEIGKMELESTLRFDEDTKKFKDADLIMTIDLKDDSLLSELKTEEDKKILCSFVANDGDCKVTVDGKKVKINVKNAKTNEDFFDKTKEEVKEYMEEQQKEDSSIDLKCS